MITFEVDSGSVQQVASRLERARSRILEAIQVGMREAMVGLADFAASRAPVRSGALLAAILKSPKVTTNSTVVRGTVSGDVGKKHVALWQELGIKVPAVSGKFMAFNDQGEQFFIQSHKAFQVPGKPFMNPALQEYKEQIIETIRGRVNEAVAGA